MTINSKTTMEPIHAASIPVPGQRLRYAVSKVVRFILHLLEMLLAMMVGMFILYSLEDLVPATSSFTAVFESGTNLYDLAMGLFMTVPMVAWMVVRGHGWRHGAEMGFAMFAPVAAIILLRLLGADDDLPWLADAGHLAMPLAMIIAMLYRRDHYTGIGTGFSPSTHPRHSEHSK